jgi:two-component system, chemotaxis family, sensor histidine kinase and response regulator PixL
MTPDSIIRKQTYSYFLTEAQDLLQEMEQDLLSLRRNRSLAKVHNLMRAAHTLKGAAASVGFESMKTMAHTLEDVFKTFYQPEVAIDAELEALLFEGYECLRMPLTAALAGMEPNDAEVLERATSVFGQLQAKLGDHFNPGASIPSSAELGFDITQSIFETGVRERLEQLSALLSEKDAARLTQTLQTQAEVFVGLAESMGLSGFGAIAQTTLAALKANPERIIEIAQAALADFQRGQIAVLTGDRARGGEPSEVLKQLAGKSKPVRQRSRSTSKLTPQKRRMITRSWHRLIAFLNRPLWTKTPSPAPLSSIPSRKPSISQAVVVSVQPVSDDLIDTASLEAAFEELANSFPAEVSQPEAVKFELWDIGESEEASVNDSLQESIPTGLEEQPQSMFQISAKQIFQMSEKQSAPHSQSETTTSSTIRVALEHLDALNNSTSELLINHNQQALQDERLRFILQELMDGLRQHQQTMTQLRDWSDQMLTAPEQERRKRFERSGINSDSVATHSTQMFDSLELDRHNEFHGLLQSALAEVVQLEDGADAIDLVSRESSHSLQKQGRLLSNVRDDLMDVRMVPVGTILNRFPRVLQQLMETHGKTVDLQIQGTHVLVDKAVAEKLYDPLLHLIRNAFDHGIETAESRRQQGKSGSGQIEIHAYQQGNRTIVEVRDDGQGLDLHKICRRGYELQLLASDRVDDFSKSDLFGLLFEPGFSTADQVSDLSGRGVGLDVVKSSLRSLKGSIKVDSEPGRGTTFSLQLPLTLMSARLLVCQVGQGVYGILSDEVEKILTSQSGQIETVAGRRMFHWQQEARPILLHSLSRLVNYGTSLLPSGQENRGVSFPVLAGDISPLLLIRQQGELFGLEVDRIIGEQELVIRPMGTAIAPPSYIYGCSVLGDGQLILVINSGALASQGTSQGLNTAIETVWTDPDRRMPNELVRSSPETPQCVLVVDDSVTVRQTLALTLEGAGYRVLQAQDGLEAIAQVQQHREIQLITCDVEMPRLNGFEFLMRYTQEPSAAQSPVVMLTSRSNEKHQQLAAQLGASAYMTKPYAEPMLLETIAGLIAKKGVKSQA